MNVESVLQRLEALGEERVRERNRRRGVGDEQFGVRLGEVRKVAASLGKNHELARALWSTGTLEARLVAVLTFDPSSLSADDLDAIVRDAGNEQVADWTSSYLLAKHPATEELRIAWLAGTDVHGHDRWTARAAWRSTSSRARTAPASIDAAALLDRIAIEAPSAPREVQWTMNECLASIGIHDATLRTRAIALGETLGLFRDYPVSKGCTSPFAPIWIGEMVRRQGEGARA